MKNRLVAWQTIIETRMLWFLLITSSGFLRRSVVKINDLTLALSAVVITNLILSCELDLKLHCKIHLFT